MHDAQDGLGFFLLFVPSCSLLLGFNDHNSIWELFTIYYMLYNTWILSFCTLEFPKSVLRFWIRFPTLVRTSRSNSHMTTLLSSYPRIFHPQSPLVSSHSMQQAVAWSIILQQHPQHPYPYSSRPCHAQPLFRINPPPQKSITSTISRFPSKVIKDGLSYYLIFYPSAPLIAYSSGFTTQQKLCSSA